MKKFIAAFCMLTAILTIAVSANAEEVLWLEAENASFDSEYVSEENSSASGGEVITIFTKTDPDDGSYTIDFSANTDSAGKYDIWILSTLADSKNYSKLSWSVNDSEKSEYEENGEERPAVYKHKAAYVNQDICWNRLAAEADFVKGENTVSLYVEAPSLAGAKSYLSVIDCIVIVPAYYSWQPQDNIEYPDKPSQKFALIELENPTSPTRLETSTSGDASGGKMLFAHGTTFGDDEDTAERLVYSFAVDEDTDYDIWYLGCAGDSASGNLSGMFWGMDDHIPDVIGTADRNEQGLEDKLIIMNSAGGTSGIPMYWSKLGTKSLSSGVHSLNVAYTYRSMSNGMYLWADCVLVVPSEWNWRPPTEDNEEKLPAYSIGKLDGRYIAEKYFTGDYSALTENIVLPSEKLSVPAKSEISFESSNTDVLSDGGEVTRPYYNQSDADVDFMVVATRDGKKATYNIPVTILRYPKYQCTSFKASKSNDGKVINAEALLKVMAQPDSGEEGSADIIIAYYDNNGILQGIKQSTKAISTDETPITASLEIPEISGYAKVFLINNSNIGKRLADTINIR